MNKGFAAYKDIPFKWQGRDRATGLDCFTLASLVSQCESGKPFDLTLPPIVDAYSRWRSAADVPPMGLADVASELGLQKAFGFQRGNIVLIRSDTAGLCLGTVVKEVVDGQQRSCLVFMGARRSRCCPLTFFAGSDIHAIFEPRKLHG